MGSLARDLEFKGQGIGPLLVRDALERAWRHSAEIGSVGVVTDPKDATAAMFYQKFGFQPLDERRMFVPEPVDGRSARLAHFKPEAAGLPAGDANWSREMA